MQPQLASQTAVCALQGYRHRAVLLIYTRGRGQSAQEQLLCLLPCLLVVAASNALKHHQFAAI